MFRGFFVDIDIPVDLLNFMSKPFLLTALCATKDIF